MANHPPKGNPAACLLGDILRSAKALKREGTELVEAASTKRDRQVAERDREETTKVMGAQLNSVREAYRRGEDLPFPDSE